jgi:MazG family protein
MPDPGSSVAREVARLLGIMAALRTPGTGCPWDMAQTFATIAPYTIEEAYEVADAIDRSHMSNLKEELGDLLLQVVYHARMAEEQGAFSFADVAAAVSEKMVRRHPHVFGTPEQRAAGAPKGFWENAKAEERRERSVASSSPEPLLDAVPVGLPGLTRAVKLQDKAAKVGFDWPSLAPVFAKMQEELAELEDVVAKSDRTAIDEEYGDLLFVLANVARHLAIDPESSLRSANQKFMRRFRYIEEQLFERGSSPVQSTLSEMDALWDEAKDRERSGPKP